MNIYNSKRWKLKRECILKRDRYLCQECKRYGKRVDADTVHHIQPYEAYPEYAYKDSNLISLCNKCHNAMHIRDTHELTVLGKQWQEKRKVCRVE